MTSGVGLRAGPSRHPGAHRGAAHPRPTTGREADEPGYVTALFRDAATALIASIVETDDDGRGVGEVLDAGVARSLARQSAQASVDPDRLEHEARVRT